MLPRLGQDTNAIEDALYRTEVGKMHQRLFSSAPVPGRLINVAIDEVMNRFDGPLYTEEFPRVFAEVAADAGNTIRFFDGKFGDWEIGVIGAHQRNIGA